MNNSYFAIQQITIKEEPKDPEISLRQREATLVKIVEAINEVVSTNAWQFLEKEVFSGVEASLKRMRDSEVEKKPLNGPMIHSLNGQLMWAKKYSNLASLANIYKQELSNIRKAYAKNNSRRTGSSGNTSEASATDSETN